MMGVTNTPEGGGDGGAWPMEAEGRVLRKTNKLRGERECPPDTWEERDKVRLRDERLRGDLMCIRIRWEGASERRLLKRDRDEERTK